MGIVGDGDAVGIRVIADGVDARHLTSADVVYTKKFRVGGVFGPAFLTLQTCYNLLAQCDGRARGMVELMHVVGLLQLHVVLRELVHNLSQVAVDG